MEPARGFAIQLPFELFVVLGQGVLSHRWPFLPAHDARHNRQVLREVFFERRSCMHSKVWKEFDDQKDESSADSRRVVQEQTVRQAYHKIVAGKNWNDGVEL